MHSYKSKWNNQVLPHPKINTDKVTYHPRINMSTIGAQVPGKNKQTTYISTQWYVSTKKQTKIRILKKVTTKLILSVAQYWITIFAMVS